MLNFKKLPALNFDNFPNPFHDLKWKNNLPHYTTNIKYQKVPYGDLSHDSKLYPRLIGNLNKGKFRSLKSSINVERTFRYLRLKKIVGDRVRLYGAEANLLAENLALLYSGTGASLNSKAKGFSLASQILGTSLASYLKLRSKRVEVRKLLVQDVIRKKGGSQNKKSTRKGPKLGSRRRDLQPGDSGDVGRGREGTLSRKIDYYYLARYSSRDDVKAIKLFWTSLYGPGDLDSEGTGKIHRDQLIQMSTKVYFILLAIAYLKRLGKKEREELRYVRDVWNRFLRMGRSVKKLLCGRRNYPDLIEKYERTVVLTYRDTMLEIGKSLHKVTKKYVSSTGSKCIGIVFESLRTVMTFSTLKNYVL